LNVPRYRLGKRQQQAENTRARILGAARDLLEQGRDGKFTIDVVAERAGVARMTVFNQFGSLAGLLEAMFDDVAGPYMARQMPEVFRAPDPEAALRQLVTTFAGLWERSPALSARLRGFAAFDAAIDASLRTREQRRVEAGREVLRRLWSGRLPPPWQSLDEAALALFALTSFPMWTALGGSDEPPEAVRDRLLRMVTRLFVPPAG
jgi:AcrR family transcriptional regulator